MTDRQTPETDAFFTTFADGEAAPSHAEYYDRMVRLERERDEVLQQLTALKDPVKAHAMMLRGEIALDTAKVRHLFGYDDLMDMLYRCEAWFSTLPEGRKMQLECQRIIDRHNSKLRPTTPLNQ